MKKTSLFAFLVAGSMAFYSCGGDSDSSDSTEESSDSTSTKETEPEVVQKSCLPETVSFKLGNGARKMQCFYADGKLDSVSVDMTFGDKQRNLSTKFNYDGDKISTLVADGKTTTYNYDESGMMSTITSESGYQDINFTYGEDGKMTEMTMGPADKPFSKRSFEYDGDKPVKVSTYSGKDLDLLSVSTLEYDDKNNPFATFDLFSNPVGMVYGYPIGTYGNNLIKVSTEYMKDEKFMKVNGEAVTKGLIVTRELTLEYNEDGYPTGGKDQDGNETGTITYVCE